MADEGGWNVEPNTVFNQNRNIFKRAIERFQVSNIATPEFDNGNIYYLNLLMARLDAQWKGYSTCHDQVLGQVEVLRGDPDELNVEYERECAALSQVYHDVRAIIENKIKTFTRSTNVHVPRPAEVHLGEFNGDYTKYTAFRSSVKARVLNADYPAHTKIDLITSALRGPVIEHIGHVRDQDEAELKRIWTALEGRYFNPYLLIRAHVRQIMQLPKIERATVTAYRLMIDSVNQQLHALSQLSVVTPPSDPFVLELLYQKLDSAGTQAWESTRDQLQLPSIASFLTFLEARVVILSNTEHQLTGQAATQPVKPSEHNRGRPEHRQENRSENRLVGQNEHKRQNDRSIGEIANKRAKSTNNDTKPPPPPNCLMQCDTRRPHYLYLCRKFRALDLEGRLKFVAERKLCRRCVNATHAPEQCKAEPCWNCPDDAHNYILCPKYLVVAKANVARPEKGGRGRRGRKARPRSN